MLKDNYVLVVRHYVVLMNYLIIGVLLEKLLVFI